MRRIAPALAILIVVSMWFPRAAVTQGNHPPCRKADSLALVAIYEALDGRNWKSTATYCPGPRCWLHDDTWVRNWFGVEFAGDLDSMVTELKLDDEQLVGTLPAEIGDLEFLTHLELQNNAIGFDLPESISELWSLEVLNVSGNLITGYPAGLYDLPFLEVVDLSDNALGGRLPEGFASMRVLKYLYLSGNNFEGPIPASFLGMSGLRGLFLGQNALSGEIPSDLSGLASLLFLILSDNELEGDAPSVKYPPELRILFLQNNRFAGRLNTIKIPETLERLYLQGNQIQGWVPQSLARLKDVQLHDNLLFGVQGASQPGSIQNFSVHLNQLTFDGMIAGRSWGTGDFFNYAFHPQKQIQGLALLHAAALGESVRFHDDAFTGRGEDADIYTQWLRNGTAIAGATGSILDYGPVTMDDSGARFSVNATSPQVRNVTLTSTPSKLVVLESTFKQSGLAIVTWMSDMDARCAAYVSRGLGGIGSRLRKGDVLVPGDVITYVSDCRSDQETKVTFGSLGTFSLRPSRGGKQTRWEVDKIVLEEVITSGDFVLGSGIIGLADPGETSGKTTSFEPRHSIKTPHARITTQAGVHMSVIADSTTTTINLTNGSATVAFDTLLTKSMDNHMVADSITISAWQTVDVDANGIRSIADFAISNLEISPDTITVSTGADWTFTAIGSNGAGSESPVNVVWTADGGEIDAEGYFKAGMTPGTFDVEASEPRFGLIANAVVNIKERTGVANEAGTKFEAFRIGSAYPNPFSSTTTIPIVVDRPGRVTLSAYDILGRKVAIILDKELLPGRQTVAWSGRSNTGAELSSGIYYLVLQSHAGRRTTSLILVK